MKSCVDPDQLAWINSIFQRGYRILKNCVFIILNMVCMCRGCSDISAMGVSAMDISAMDILVTDISTKE